jgi:hypothetical protein
MSAFYPKKSPQVMTVLYESGREETHYFSSFTDASKAREKFEKVPSVVRVKIQRGRRHD